MVGLFVLTICLVMIGWGLVRYVMAWRRKEEHSGVHILWIPGAALLYAGSILLWAWT
jgi:hypothetical protein